MQCVLGAPSGAQEGLRRARRRGRRAGGGAEALPNSERPAHFPPMLFRQLDRDMCHSYLNKPSAPWAARPAALPPPPPPPNPWPDRPPIRHAWTVVLAM